MVVDEEGGEDEDLEEGGDGEDVEVRSACSLNFSNKRPQCVQNF